ncbi:short-chain dehydrogenase/reductase (plasmid) [Azospirillum sp. B510]|nr:short-chain dehydrogenase/reductase [Azospirillum sp. B510]
MVTHEPEPAFDEAAIASLVGAHGTLDILVNGAVRTGFWPLDGLTMEEWDRVHAVNARAAFLLMKAAVTVMRAHGRGGRLINISTIGSVHPVLNGNYAYGASRAATNALTRQFALDFAADGILANAILVGAVLSDPFPDGCQMPPTGPGATPGRMLRGLGSPEDIVPTALLLASAAGRYITGQTIAVDGGFLVS